MRQNTVGCIPSLAGLRPISIEESSVSNLVLSTGSNHYVIHVPAFSYAHPIHVTRTCNKPSFPLTGNLWISVRRERRTLKVK